MFIGKRYACIRANLSGTLRHAVTYTEQDSLPQAETYIRRALKLEPANPHNALLFSNLGTIQRRQRKYEKALESYNFALNIAPRAVPILLNRATIYMERGATTWHKPTIRWCWIWRKTTKKPC